MRERETERYRERVRAYDKRVVRDEERERKSVCDVERQREIQGKIKQWMKIEDSESGTNSALLCGWMD